MPSLSAPLSQCHWIDFPSVHDVRGTLSFIEGERHIPFDIKRVYYLYDIPQLAERAGHAHRELSQVFIAISGSFDLHLDDGVEQRTIQLSRANRGYLTKPWTWRTLDNFSGNSVCVVLASHAYDESDYIRDHTDFVREARQRLGLDA
ncbi:MAG: FdtA/QdtA family cupin domain-containing protein [Acetobacter orientalis]|uniref:sugar 3,4-ketoisomerase n=1 Tax=Acetobacter orientalis TaxID=146474 RepID=UPI0039E9708F